MATAADAAAQLETFNKSRVNPEAALSTAESKYGVGALQGQLDSLRSLSSNLKRGIDNVAPSVQGRTQGSLVPQAALDAITNNERQPLVKQFNDVGGQLSDTGSQYQNATGLASNYANSLLDSDKQRYGELFGQYQTLSEQERATAQAAEQRRQFDATLAEQQASRKASAASSGAGLSLGGLGGGSTTQAAPAALPQYAKGTTPQQAVADAFSGYKPGVKPGYTESVVLPAIERLLTLNNPKQPIDVIKGAAQSLVYSYRKSTFGE